MIALIFSSILSIYIYILIGMFVSRIAKLTTDFTEKILVGLALVNTITALVSLFLPINSYVLLALLVLCSIIAITMRDEIKLLFYTIKIKLNIVLYALPFIAVAFFISLGAPQFWDAGLYHIQSIKWIEEYSVVPGLANLHGRFGFNPNIFSVFALTSLFEIFHQEIFSINFTIFSVLILYFINQLYLTFKQYGIINLFVFNFIIFITILNLLGNLTEPTPDFIALSLPLFILSKLFKSAVLNENIELKKYVPVLILSIYVITVKLSTIPIIAFPLLMFLKFKYEKRKLILLTTLLGLIILPWLVRNIILTGWLIYPFHLIDFFSFDWKVPTSELINMNNSITGWARIPGELSNAASQMSIVEWFPYWWHRLILTDKLEFLASLFFPLIIFSVYLIKNLVVTQQE